MLAPHHGPRISPGSVTEATYHKTTLDNGIRVVSETIPYVRSISLGVWADVGSRDEPEDKSGLSHFFEHMVFKGTKKRSIREIAQSLESVGGYLNAFTTKDHTCFYARILDEHLVRAMDVLSDIVLHPTFPTEELEKEKRVVLEELKNAEDTPEEIIHDYFEKELFPSHALGRPIIGNEKTILQFTKADLHSHMARHYDPSRIVVTAAGNVEHGRLVQIVEKYFRGMNAAGEKSARSPAVARNGLAATREYVRPINQAHVCVGRVSYGIKHACRYPLMVMNALLGEGMSSRLYQNLRERHGLAYTVYSYVNMLSDTGVFGVYVGTDRKKLSKAVELVYRELSKLASRPVPRNELERTKSQIKGTLMLGMENMSGRMMRLGGEELYFERHTPIDTILKRVEAVTPDAVQQVASDLFKESEMTKVVITPS